MATQAVTIDNFIDTIKEGLVVFGKVDTEDQQALAGEFGITSIPTVMAFRDGVRVFSQAGALPKASLEDLIKQVEGLDMDEVRAKINEMKG